MKRSFHRPALFAALGVVLLLAACERPPMDSVQHGYRGTGMDQVYNPRIQADQASLNEVPAAPPPASGDGPKASQTYQNVKVLGDLSVAQFARTMVAITSWVSPNEGCTYCHAGANFADDSKYQKVVARRMLQMTQHINSDWKTHVANTGVTCYTCHRGLNVPANIWYAPQPDAGGDVAGNRAGQNAPAMEVGYASLPNDPFSTYLSGANEVRVVSTNALPMPGEVANAPSLKDTEATYGLMMHMSKSLGVNCTYCHNTRSFQTWDTSTPQRATAWYGIRMARDLNGAYLNSLAGVFPPARLGPAGDVPKLDCATCHQGAYKPLYGVSQLHDFPELAGPGSPTAASAAATVLGKILFDTGKVQLNAEAMQVVASTAASLQADTNLHVALSGYTDSSGNVDANAELAKQRAMAVRDALKAAGAPEDRIEMRKPEVSTGGDAAEARRVDVVTAR